jgi:hypothetical protein
VSDIHLDVMPDHTAINGGRAVIKLSGIFYLPTDVTYRIDPVDSRIKADTDPGWPGGERRPNHTRIAADGIELVLGPDVVDAKMLAPGTPVRVAIAAAAIETELRWPDIPRSNARTRHPKLLPPPPPRRSLSGQTETDGAPAARKLPGQDGHASERTRAGTPSDELASILDELRDQKSASSGGMPTGKPHTAHSKPKAGWDDDAEPFDENPYVNVQVPIGRSARRSRPSLVKPFVIGLLVAGVTSTAGWFAFHNEFENYVQKIAATRLAEEKAVASAATVQPLPPPSTAQVRGAVPEPNPIAEISSPEMKSPSGRSAQGVTADEALTLADRHLGSTPPDQAEARYWLRIALARTLGSRQMTWGLTQLGTLYAARENGEKGYAKARTLWQIAGAQGDPVALCFLARMHEQGLGAPANPRRASELYAQATRLGGCPRITDFNRGDIPDKPRPPDQ